MPLPSVITVGIISLGCAKNLVDAEHISARLRTAGYRFTTDLAVAEVLIVNTCAFIHDARKESVDAILQAATMKQNGACRFLVVAGCMAQRYALDLPASLPEVDAFIGIDQLDDITGVLDTWLHGRRKPATVTVAPDQAPQRLFDPPPERQVLTGGPYAYVKISEGCNHRCAFCAIPAIRGRARSRSIGAIVTEVEALLAGGIQEINLVAQDTTAYGRDRRDGSNLAGLLRALDGIGGDFWIRLLYGFPTLVTDTLLRTMAQAPRICRYLDIPIQHSHPDMLRRMGRFQTVPAVNRLADRARAIMPDVTLRTTCLVGHPGESNEAFEHLRHFLDTAQFDHLGVFVFSPEEGTPSADVTPRVPAPLARRRRALLMREQQQRVARGHQQRIGSTERILLERVTVSGKSIRGIGRSMRQAPEVDGLVHIRATQPTLSPGQFVTVRYETVRRYDLTAAIT